MRLKSSIFVSALMRREQAEGAFATILRKGAEEGGTVYIVHLKPQGADVYAPAPQLFIGETNPFERYFEQRLDAADPAAVSDYLDKQVRFDSDCWIVEIEKSAPLTSIQVVAGA
ncbi:MAG: DUF1491 family protein [Nitratireductor sp.]|nr:DUF1491 family protein [Nitratireductor sp.]